MWGFLWKSDPRSTRTFWRATHRDCRPESGYSPHPFVFIPDELMRLVPIVRYRIRERRVFARVALMLIAMLAGCQSMNDMLKMAPKPSARVADVKFRGVTLDKLDLVFDVEVSNPYSASLPLLRVSYQLASGGQKILDGALPTGTSIPASGSSLVALPVSVQFASLLRTLQGVRPGSVVPYEASFDVSVDAPVVGPRSLPVSHRGELPVPAVPDVSLVSFDVGAMSLDKVEATARLRVKNTNQFAVDLGMLSFDLALGGQRVAHSASSGGQKLAPGQSGDVAVPLSFSPRELGVSILSVLRGGESAYAVNGSVELGTAYGLLKLPFSQKGSARIGR